MAVTESKTEKESLLATERLFKLKSALVMPLRYGKRHRNHVSNSVEKRLWSWIEGNHEQVWKAALKIEESRAKKDRGKWVVKKKSKSIDVDSWSASDMKKRYLRAKRLCNDGRVLKSF